MAQDFSLNLRMDLRTFRAALKDVKSGLLAIGTAPLRQVAAAFAPAAAGAKKFLSAVKEGQLALLGLAGAAGGALAAISREAAADEAVLARFRATFGEMADEVQAFGSELAKSTRRTEGGVQGLLVGFQEVLKGMQLGDKEAAGFSKQLAALTVNLAAFRGESEETVLTTLQTALARGGPAVVRYGINLDEARIKQEAFNKGFDPKHLTEQQEALVKLTLILRDTQAAQDGASQTAGTFRERLVGLRNAFAELLSDIGRNVNTTVGPFLDRVRESVNAVREWIAENPKLAASITGAVASVLGFVVALGTLGPIVANAVSILGALFGLVAAGLGVFTSLAGSVAALAAIFAGLSLVGVIEGFRRFFTESEKAQRVLEGLREAFGGIFGGLKDIATAIIEPIQAFVQNVGDAVFGVLEESADSLGATFVQVGETIGGVLSRIADGIRVGLASAFAFLEPIVVQAVTSIIAIFEDLPSTFEVIGQAASSLAAFLGDIFGILTGQSIDLGSAFQSLQGFVIAAIKGIEEALTSESIIKVLSVLRIGVASLALGFTGLYSAGQLAVAGLIELFAELTRAVGYVLKAMGLVSDTAAAAAEDVLDFADRATDKAIELAEDANRKLVEVAQRTRAEIVDSLKQFHGAASLSDELRAERAERAKVIAQLQESRKIVQGMAKDEQESLKQRIDGQAKAKELTEAQRAELQSQAREARDIFLTDLARAQTQDAITEATNRHSIQLDEIKKKALDLVEANRNGARSEEAKGEAARKTNVTLEDQEEITKRIEKAQQEAKASADALLESRVKSTKTLEDDIALLRKQADLAADNAKSDKERGEIRLAYRLKEAQLIEENARKEREAAKQALDDLDDRKKAFQDFVKSVNRESARREGRDLEVQVEEIGDRFKEQIQNLTKVSDIQDFKKALSQAITEPLDEARRRAQEAREELSKLIAQRAGLNAGDRSGATDLVALQNEINRQRDAVAQADRRVAALAQKANDVQVSLSTELALAKDQIAASEAARADLEKKAAESKRLDEQGASIADPAQIVEAQNKATEAATKARDASVEASEIAVQNASAAEALSGVGAGLADALRGGLQGLAERVGEIKDVLVSLVDLQPIFEAAEVALVTVVEQQRLFGQSLDDFGNLILTKFGETADGFTSHKRIIDAIAAKLAAVDIRRAAGDSSLEDLGLVSP